MDAVIDVDAVADVGADVGGLFTKGSDIGALFTEGADIEELFAEGEEDERVSASASESPVEERKAYLVEGRPSVEALRARVPLLRAQLVGFLDELTDFERNFPPKYD